MSGRDQWRWFFAYWLVAAIAFGWRHIVWMRRRRAKGETVTSPIGDFVASVVMAPIALLIVAGCIWELLRSLKRIM